MKTTLTFILIFFASIVFSQNIAGRYLVNGQEATAITITKFVDETAMYKIKTTEGWEGTGILYTSGNIKTLMAIFKYNNQEIRGVHSAILQKNGNFEVSIRLWKDVWNKPQNKISHVSWVKQKK